MLRNGVWLVRWTRNDGIWAMAIGVSWLLAGFDLISPRMHAEDAALFWAPNAILAVALLRRMGTAPIQIAFCVAALVTASITGSFVSHSSALDWAILGLGNIGEAWLVAYVAQRFGGPSFSFHRPRMVVVWIAGVLAATTMSMVYAFACARVGLGAVTFPVWPESALSWILGDSAPHLTLGALLVVATSPEGGKLRATILRDPERALAHAAVVLISAVVGFMGPQLWGGARDVVHPGYLALMVPALMWAAFRYGAGGAAAASLMALAPGIALTVAGWGPFHQPGADMALDLQVLIVALAGATLLIGVLGATLRDARDTAATADRSKTLFLSRIGHELRTPLNGVIGGADLLALDLAQAPATQQDRLDLVRSSARTLAAVVEDLVEYAAMHREGVSVRPVAFEARRPFDDAVAIFAPRAQWNGVALRLVQRDLADVWIISDPARLRQVLFALVANAVEATTRGEIIIDVALERIVDPRALLRIVVQDTGPGIPPERQRDIFEPFQQGETDVHRPSPGLGLGLAVAKETIEALGGAIALESAPGEGATFTITLPVERVVAPPHAALISGKAHALLAEDNPTSRIVLSAMLSSLGFDVMSVETGAEALAAVTRNDFELIVMDIQMPVMDGEEATQRIRALEGPRAKTPIVIVTAHALSGDDRRYLASGADEVVAKPVDLRALAAAVARVVTQPDANA